MQPHIIQLYGLRRSGSHAILAWLLNNLEYQYGKSKVGFINDAPVTGNFFEQYLQMFKEKFDAFIITYEDTELQTSFLDENHHKLVIIRDIYNMIASRLKRNTKDTQVDENIVKLWLEYANAEPFKYEDFLLDKESRDNMCHKLQITNYDYTEKVMSNGNGSSFIGVKLDEKINYLNRYKMIEFPSSTLDLLKAPEIEQARLKLGYPVIIF